MIQLTITPTGDLSPRLTRLLADLEGPKSKGLGMVMGRGVANEIKKHFRERNQTPNALGGKRTNFWAAVANSVQTPQWQPGQVSVAINHPAIAQKVFGGTIHPTKAKNLAIPVDPRAYGKSPRVFEALHYARTKEGTGLLGMTEGEKFIVYYVLRKSVTQKPDPNALPSGEAMREAATKAGEIHLSRP